ncbi:major surface protein 1B-2 [Anaplasma centrale str. Israel]|uniref:Major surface protein 1B-2 n=1 Tax=Anaplasma centrale (strain Israel) TaxID=574556 RepID=D1AT08_ANACI|nr:major surface protein 1B-2 [Anaplasma centrale str. Israel]
MQEGPMGKVAGKGLEKCREKLEAASQKWVNAWQEVDALRLAISRGEQELEAAKAGEGEAWSPKGVESNAFYSALNTIGQKIADAAQATWEGLAITGKFIGNAAKIAGVGALCTAAILTAMVPVVSLPMFAAMGISPTADAWIQNKIEKAEKFVDDQMSDAARSLVASELVTAVSGALVAVGAGFRYIFTPVHNAIKGSVEQDLTVKEGLEQIKEDVKEIGITAKLNAVGQAMTHAGVYAVVAIRQGFSAETRNSLKQGIEAVYNSIKEFVTGLAAPIGSYDAVEEAINREATKIQKTEVDVDAVKAPSLVTNLKNAGVITAEEAQRLEQPAPSISSVARRLGYGAQALAEVMGEELSQDAKDLAAEATPAEREAVDNAIQSVVSAVQDGQAPEPEAVIAAMDSTVEKPAQDRGVEQASQSKDGIEGIDQDALKEAAEGFTGAVEAAEGQVAPLNTAEVAGKGLEKCREKLEAASQKWFSAWQEVDALGTAVSRGEQELEAAAKEGEGEAWSPKGVESNAFYKALNTIGQKIADAAQATWEGLAITGKFIGNAAKIAGVGALCTAAILTAMVPVVSLPMFAAMGISPTADAWIQNKIEKAEKFVDDQMSDAARGLAASELVTAVSGALVAVGAGFQYIFTPVHNAIKGSVEEGLYKIKEGVQETNQSIMAKFNAVGQAMTHAGVYAVAAIRQGFSAEARNSLKKGIEAVYNSIKEFVTGPTAQKFYESITAPIGSYEAIEAALDVANAPSLVTNLKNAGVITTEEAQRLERPAPSISSVARRLGYGAQALAEVMGEELSQDAKDLAAEATPAEREAVDNAIQSVVAAVQDGQAPEPEAVIAAIEGAAMDSTVEKPAQDRGVEQASQSKDGIEGIDQDALKEAAEGFTGAVEAAEGQVAPLNAAEVAAAQGHQQSSGMSR